MNGLAAHSAVANTHVIICEKCNGHAVKVMREEHLLT